MPRKKKSSKCKGKTIQIEMNEKLSNNILSQLTGNIDKIDMKDNIIVNNKIEDDNLKSDEEYIEVEVEVDEDGNEIFNSNTGEFDNELTEGVVNKYNNNELTIRDNETLESNGDNEDENEIGDIDDANECDLNEEEDRNKDANESVDEEEDRNKDANESVDEEEDRNKDANESVDEEEDRNEDANESVNEEEDRNEDANESVDEEVDGNKDFNDRYNGDNDKNKDIVNDIHDGYNQDKKYDRNIIEENNINEELSKKSQQVNLIIKKNEPINKKYILMGLSSGENAQKVIDFLGSSVKDYTVSTINLDRVSFFLNSKFIPKYRMPGDGIITQRLSIYTQLYKVGGLFINPAIHNGLKDDFEKIFTQTGKNKGNVYLLLNTKKTQVKCNLAAKRHSIRGGKPEREIQIDSQFLYSREPKHEFWIDVIKIAQKRFNQTVPKGERIDTITNYGRSFLGGQDLLSEAYYKFGKKYDDVVLLEPEEYNNIIGNN
jgi:hypothetical protein